MSLTDARITQIIEDYGGNFRPEEFGDDREKLHPELIRNIVGFRNWTGFQVQVTSAFRHTGSHRTGRSIDFLLWTSWQDSQPHPHMIWRLLTSWPWWGVGIYFDWNDGIGCHGDVIQTGRRRPLRWLRNQKYYYQSVVNGRFYHDQEEVTLENEIDKYLRYD